MKTWVKGISGLISVILFLGACSQKNEPPAKESAPNKVPQTVRVKQTAPEQRKNRSPQAVAKHLVQIARSVPNVKDASAIVLGRYTIVGINLDPTLDRGRTGTIKYTVAEALHEDPQGANAFVTADPGLVQRIRELNEDVRNGKPIQGILEELAEITARIVPQPSRETEKTERKPSRTNQERLK